MQRKVQFWLPRCEKLPLEGTRAGVNSEMCGELAVLDGEICGNGDSVFVYEHRHNLYMICVVGDDEQRFA